MLLSSLLKVLSQAPRHSSCAAEPGLHHFAFLLQELLPTSLFSLMLQAIVQAAKAAVLNVTDIELKALDATNMEAWGPSGSAMQELAGAAQDPENYSQIMGILHQRLQEKGENWRLCYKALLVIEYLCKHGPLVRPMLR